MPVTIAMISMIMIMKSKGVNDDMKLMIYDNDMNRNNYIDKKCNNGDSDYHGDRI